MNNWPIFWFDCNSWFGKVDSREKFDEAVGCIDAHGGGCENGFEHMLNGRLQGRVRRAEDYGDTYDKETLAGVAKGIAMEVADQGDAPNFGWRREHTSDIRLGEWLRSMGCHLVPADWVPRHKRTERL